MQKSYPYGKNKIQYKAEDRIKILGHGGHSGYRKKGDYVGLFGTITHVYSFCEKSRYFAGKIEIDDKEIEFHQAILETL